MALTENQTAKNAKNFGYRALLLLAWPVVVARATQAVVGFADAWQVAPLGEEALAASATGAMNTIALVIFPMGIVMIVQSFVAQLMGQNRQEAAIRFAWYGLILACFIGIISLCSIPFVENIIGLFGYKSEVHTLMSDYLKIRLTSIFFIIIMEALGAWFGGMGNTRVHMRAGIIVMICNVILNALLIEGRLGMPRLGVEGAALSSAISSLVGASYMLLTFFYRSQALTPISVRPKNLSIPEFTRVLRFGFTNGLNWFLEFSAFILFVNLVVGKLGATTLSAFMTVLNMNSVSFMPAFGISTAGAILAGNAIGQNQKSEVSKILKRVITLNCTWQGTVGFIYLLFPNALMQAFNSEAQSITFTLLAVEMLRLSTAWQLFDAIGLSTGESLRAAGDTLFPAITRLILAWICFIPLAQFWVLSKAGGPKAAIGCVIIYLGALALLLLFRFRLGAWKRIELIDHRSDLILQ